jgi:hypothetical protein
MSTDEVGCKETHRKFWVSEVRAGKDLFGMYCPICEEAR